MARSLRKGTIARKRDRIKAKLRTKGGLMTYTRNFSVYAFETDIYFRFFHDMKIIGETKRAGTQKVHPHRLLMKQLTGDKASQPGRYSSSGSSLFLAFISSQTLSSFLKKYGVISSYKISSYKIALVLDRMVLFLLKPMQCVSKESKEHKLEDQ